MVDQETCSLCFVKVISPFSKNYRYFFNELQLIHFSVLEISSWVPDIYVAILNNIAFFGIFFYKVDRILKYLYIVMWIIKQGKDYDPSKVFLN
jgi:hypothetical protein